MKKNIILYVHKNVRATLLEYGCGNINVNILSRASLLGVQTNYLDIYIYIYDAFIFLFFCV